MGLVFRPAHKMPVSPPVINGELQNNQVQRGRCRKGAVYNRPENISKNIRYVGAEREDSTNSSKINQ